MGFRYAVLGAGMQGTACAYDMAKFGDAKEVLLADMDIEKAHKAAARVNKLIGFPDMVKGVKLDVKNEDELVKLLTGVDSFLSAVPYNFHVTVAKAAVQAKASMCDLGGNTDVVFEELKLDSQAKEAGITIIPDCGLMPGMGNTLAVYGMSKLDSCNEVQIRCGGLPQNPKPPLGYKLVFNIGGLTNEYFGKAFIVRNGKVAEVNTFDELEELEFESPVGKCEAFTTTGGTSTCPWTFEGKVDTYEYKTVRYAGHYEKFKTMLELGLLDTEEVKVGGIKVSPRDVFHTVVAPKIDFPEDKDLVVLRATCKGLKEGKKVSLTYDIMDFHDDETGFTAMERTTAYPASIVAIMMAKGEVAKGAVSLEVGIPGEHFVNELRKRGIKLTETIKTEL